MCTNVHLYILSRFLEYLVLQDNSYFEDLSICSEKDYSYFELIYMQCKKGEKKKKTVQECPVTETRGINR